MFEEGMYSEPGRPNVPLDVINSIVHNIFLSKFCFLVGQPNFIYTSCTPNQSGGSV